MSGDSYHPLPSARSTAAPWRGVLAATALVVLAAASRSPAASTQPHGSATPAEPRGLHVAPADARSFPRPVDVDFSPVGQSVFEAETGAERIFRGDLVSMRAVATFSRTPRALDTSEGEGLDPMFNTALAGAETAAASSPGAELSATIFALQSDSSASRSPGPDGPPDESLFTRTSRGPRKAQLMFWDDADADVLYGDATGADLAAATRGAGANLVIPLPAAALSGLSVMCGVGLLAGLRRVRDRLRLRR
jgi:hypothetical protein